VNNVFKSSLKQIYESLNRVVRGNTESIELVIVAVLSGGHVLLEDVPGVGKTTLAKALARCLDMDFSRVQFTPDLLPTDILGTHVLNPQDGSFSFHEGPIFTQLLLADEINRASPRTQSALLEAMNEQQVTMDGVTRKLQEPFFVIATQNPVDYQGTYPLPEAQLDRFSIRVHLGYPNNQEEMALIFDRQLVDPLDELEPALNVEELLYLRMQARKVLVGEDVGKYLLELVRATRRHADLELGGSPRGALALFRASQARALLRGRDWVGPKDIQALAVPVLAHRLMPTVQARYGGKTNASIMAEVVERTEVPT
jgi:MoxR-like ATPase